MEKTYKIKFYYIDKHNSRLDYDLYTEKEIIQNINNITSTESKTLNEAILALSQYKNWEVKYVYREITNDDIVGNIKPDNSFTNKLEFGEFEDVVNKDEYIIKEFSTFNNQQKLTICTFIDKNIKLLNELKEENQNKPKIIYDCYINIINTFVYELFLALDYTEAETMINQMAIFNNVKNNKLIKFLHQIVENITVKQLISRDDECETILSNEFWNQIVKENKKTK